MLSEIFIVVAQETGYPVEELSRSTPIGQVAEDSLEFLNLITVLKSKFGEFPDAWIAHVKTVGDLVGIVEAIAR